MVKFGQPLNKWVQVRMITKGYVVVVIGANAALQAMLRKKLDVSSTDKTGGTALHAAAFAGHLECTHLLLEYHADPNALDILNHTPLFRACEQGHTDVVSLLINGKADPPHLITVE